MISPVHGIRSVRGASRSGGRRARLLAASLLCAAAATALPATTAQAAELGGVDLSRYCQLSYGTDWDAKAFDPGSAFSWSCVGWEDGVEVRRGINVDGACIVQYGEGARSGYYRENDAYSWFCQRD